MEDQNTKKQKKQWVPFVIGLVVTLGIGAGILFVTSIAGAESTAGKATGGASGGVVAVIIFLCAVAARRRRAGQEQE